MRRILLASTLLALALAAVRCVPFSERPLSRHPAVDPALEGVWTYHLANDAEKTGVAQFVRSKEGEMEVVLLNTEKDREGLDLLICTVLPSTIGERRFLSGRITGSFRSPKFETKGDPSYVILRYETASDGTLKIGIMKEAPVAEAIRAGKLKGAVTGSDPKITDDPENIERFVGASDPATLFAPLYEMRRVAATAPGK